MNCSNCGFKHDRNGRYCRLCHNAYMRVWRKTHPLSPEERKKDICRSYTHVLIVRGVLQKAPCEVCGDVDVHAHHPDYSNPRKVKWLCPFHHRELHKQLRETN